MLSNFGGGRGEYDVNVQSQISNKFQYFAVREIKTDITLTSDVEVGDTVIPVSAGHGFSAATVGEKICMFDCEYFFQGNIKSVADNNITVYVPMARPFKMASTVIIRGNAELRHDNSAGVEYLWKPRCATIPIDISKAIITFECGSAVPDYGKFGGAASSSIVNKFYMRKVNGEIVHLGVYGKNRDFEDLGATVTFTAKAPAGTNGVRIEFDIERVFGNVERFYPATDYFLAVAQDDYEITGIESMTLSIIGSYTSGEI